MKNLKTTFIKPTSVRKDRASALVGVVIFGAIISLAVTFAYRSTIYQHTAAARSHNYLAALNVAEAGAELAMLELNKSENPFSGWSGGNPAIRTEVIRDVMNNKVGEVTVQVADPATDPKITATGYIPSKAAAQVMRTVQLNAKVNAVSSPWGEFGLFAFGNITMSGGVNIKSFQPDNPNVNTSKATVGAKGNISLVGSPTISGNLHAGGDLYFDNNSITVTGSALYGGNFGYKPNNYPSKVAGGVHKSSIREPNRIEMPVAPKYAGTNNNNKIKVRPNNGGGQTKDGVPSGSDLSVSNSNVTFTAPGTYYLSSFKNNSNSTVNITGSGDVKIFVTGDFDLSAISNMDIAPSNNKQPGPKVTLVAKNAKFTQYGELNVKNNSEFNVFADTVTGNGSKAVTIEPDAKMVIKAGTLDYSGGANLNVKPWSTNAGNPSNLQLFATSAVKFGAGANVSGILYAPDADPVFSGGFNWWGAVIGRNINVAGGANLGVDETLFTPGAGSGAYVTAWTETAPKKI